MFQNRLKFHFIVRFIKRYRQNMLKYREFARKTSKARAFFTSMQNALSTCRSYRTIKNFERQTDQQAGHQNSFKGMDVALTLEINDEKTLICECSEQYFSIYWRIFMKMFYFGRERGGLPPFKKRLCELAKNNYSQNLFQY